MTLPALTDHEVRRLLAVIQADTFTWQERDIHDLLSDLGWTVVEDLPGEGLIADPGWNIPGSEALATYDDGRVNSIKIGVTGRAKDGDQELDVADVFARISRLAADTFQTAGERAPGDYPRLRWHTATAAVTIDRNPRRVQIIWARSDHQQRMDEAGRP